MNGICMLLGLLLCVIGSLVTVPLVIRFNREAVRVGFNIYDVTNPLALLRIGRLPASLQILGRKIRFRSIAFFWSGAAFIALGLYLTRLEKEAEPVGRSNEHSRTAMNALGFFEEHFCMRNTAAAVLVAHH